MFRYFTFRKIRNFALVGLIVSASVYAFQVTAITLNAAEARSYTADISEIETHISELELQYFELLNDLSLDEAQALGMSESKNVEFARINDIKTVAYNF